MPEADPFGTRYYGQEEFQAARRPGKRPDTHEEAKLRNLLDEEVPDRVKRTVFLPGSTSLPHGLWKNDLTSLSEMKNEKISVRIIQDRGAESHLRVPFLRPEEGDVGRGRQRRGEGRGRRSITLT